MPGTSPNWLPGSQRIAFRVPAATVGMLDLADGRMGGQRLGFELWSGTLDPFRTDFVADRAGCRPGELSPCDPVGAGGGRIGARHRAGEYALTVVVTNAVGVPGRSERVLRGQSGINPFPRPGWRHDPCDVREDSALGMLVGRAPEGVRHSDACNFLTNGATIRYRAYRPAHFMKLASDGAPKFIVKCGVYVTAADGVPPSNCEMQGDFGAWPLFISVRSDRAPEWDATFERVRAYLERHTLSRTD